MATEQRRQAALASHLRGDLFTALAAYDAISAGNHSDFDVRHMAAVCYLQLGLVPEALQQFRRLLREWTLPTESFWTNLNLLISGAACQPDDPFLEQQRAAYQHWRSDVSGGRADDDVTVSAVVPSFQHAAYVTRAIASLRAQTRPPDEIIIIDDGSQDHSAAAIERALADCPIPFQLIVRENRGAATTLNEAIERARCEWIAPLNSDDTFDPKRLQLLVAACARRGIDWGFGGVDVVDACDRTLDHSEVTAAELLAIHSSLHASESVGLAFLRCNPAISTGNLFFRKSLWTRVGGFTQLRYNHDWNFCLHAALLAEPTYVPEARYHYRWHAANTIRDNHQAPKDEAAGMMRNFLALINGSTSHPANQWHAFAPSPTHWGYAFWATLAAGGYAHFATGGQLHLLLESLDETPINVAEATS